MIKKIFLALVVTIGCIGIVGAETKEISRKKFNGFGTYSGNFLAANKALHNRDYESAVDFLMSLFVEDQSDLSVIESLFLVNLSLGEFDRATLFAEKYHFDIKGKNEPQSAHHYLSKLFLTAYQMRQGDYKKALEHLEKGDDFMISEMSYHLLSAWINFADGRPLNAVAALNNLQENSFHQIYYLINSALLAEMQDRQKDADNFYNDALLLGGTKLDLVEAYGRFLERTGREKQAFALYDDFENRGGAHPVITQARERLISGTKPAPLIANANDAIAYSFYHIANVYYGAGNYDESLNYARLAQYLAPNNSYILNILSLNYQNLDQHMIASGILEQIPPQSPFYIKAQIRIAANLEINGQNDLALAKMATLLDQNNINEDVNLAYAHMLKRNKNYTQSIDYYNQIIDQYDEPSINEANLFYNRAVALERLKRWPEAEIDFLKALQLDPNHVNALNYLGYTWVDKGIHLEQGLEMISDALLVDPQNAFIIDSLGWAYFKLGMYEKARIELERAQFVSPSNADIADHLGDVYWKLGRKLEAGFKWQSATIYKSEEINYDDLEYKREFGLDALDMRKADNINPANAVSTTANSTNG